MPRMVLQNERSSRISSWRSKNSSVRRGSSIRKLAVCYSLVTGARQCALYARIRVENLVTIPLYRGHNRNNCDNRNERYTGAERTRLSRGISELMKRELDSWSPWCRVSGSREREREKEKRGERKRESSTVPCVPSATGRSGTDVFARKKKEEKRKRDRRGLCASTGVRRNLINLFIKRFSCLCWGWRVPTGNTRRLNEHLVVVVAAAVNPIARRELLQDQEKEREDQVDEEPRINRIPSANGISGGGASKVQDTISSSDSQRTRACTMAQIFVDDEMLSRRRP